MTAESFTPALDHTLLEARFRYAPELSIATFGAEIVDLFVEERIEVIIGPDGLAGCVVGEVEYERLGRPPGTERFADGLRWWPRTRTP